MGMKKFSATLRIGHQSEKQASDLYSSLAQEADFAHRGGSRVKKQGKTVVVDIECEDPVSLRATINSYLRLMQILKTVDGAD